MFETETQEDKGQGEANEILGLLEAELEAVRKQSAKTKKVVVAIVVLMGAYLGWAGSQVNKLLDPQGLAEAATGIALEALPGAGADLRGLVVEGAPDLARAGTQAVLDLLPAYREVLEEELTPVIDEVCSILAQAVVKSMIETGQKAKSEMATQTALQAGADAVFTRLDTVLDQAMQQPTEVDGPTPLQTISVAMEKLERIDAGLKRVAAGRGDAKERELILSWISLLQRFDADAETAAIQAYKRGIRVDD